MDAILGYRPLNRAAIPGLEMDRHVLESARSAIVRAYQEFGLLSTVFDAATLCGIRALTTPFDLCHITRALVQSLIAEGFNAWWDKSGLNGPYGVKVDWRVALNSAQRARRQARHLRSKAREVLHKIESPLPTADKQHEECYESPRYAPSVAWTDDAEPILGLDMLANPQKARVTEASPESSSPRY
jgi:hypothetical protein